MQAQYVLALLLSSVHATNVLLPLYTYPATWQTPNPWQYIYDTIASHPDITFQVILNVDSGPGGDVPGYNEDWLSEVPKLNAFPNVHTFGYVPILYGKRTVTQCLQAIANWANWNTYTAANISVNGIFFDSVPNDTGKKAQAKDLALMKLITSAAHVSFDTIPSFEVIYNPGTRVENGLVGYFNMADYIIVYEEYASNYTDDDPLSGFIPDGMAAKSMFLLHDFVESQLPEETVGGWLESWAEVGLGSANILNYGYELCNSTDSSASLGEVASILTFADAQGSGGYDAAAPPS